MASNRVDVGGVVVTADIDTKTYNQKAKQMEGVAKKSGSKIGATLVKMGTAIGAAMAAAFSVRAIIQFSKKASELNAIFEETSSKAKTVFKDMQTALDAATKNLTKNFGQSKTAALDMLGGTGDLLTGLGFTQEKALELSEATSQLAIDLASFTNYSGGAKGASEALTKGLLGEREMMKSLGIAIGETDVKQRLLEQGRANLTGMALRQARAEVTLQLALEQSKNSIGDFARTQDSLANQQRVLKATVEDIYVEIGGFINREFVTPVTRNLVNLAKGTLNFIETMDRATFPDFSEKIDAFKQTREIKLLKDEFVALSDQAILTTDEEKRLLDVKEKLISLSPDFINAIDKETGSLDKNSDAYRDNAAAIEEEYLKSRNEVVNTAKEILKDLIRVDKSLASGSGYSAATQAVKQYVEQLNEQKRISNENLDIAKKTGTADQITEAKNRLSEVNKEIKTFSEIEQFGLAARVRYIRESVTVSEEYIKRLEESRRIALDTALNDKTINDRRKQQLFEQANTLAEQIVLERERRRDIEEQNKQLGIMLFQLRQVGVSEDEIKVIFQDRYKLAVDFSVLAEEELKSQEKLKNAEEERIKRLERQKAIQKNISDFLAFMAKLEGLVNPIDEITQKITDLKNELSDLVKKGGINKNQVAAAEAMIEQYEKILRDAEIPPFEIELSGDAAEKIEAGYVQAVVNGEMVWIESFDRIGQRLKDSIGNAVEFGKSVLESLFSQLSEGVSASFQGDIALAESQGRKEDAEKLAAEQKKAAEGAELFASAMQSIASKGIVGLWEALMKVIAKLISFILSRSKTLGKFFGIIIDLLTSLAGILAPIVDLINITLLPIVALFNILLVPLKLFAAVMELLNIIIAPVLGIFEALSNALDGLINWIRDALGLNVENRFEAFNRDTETLKKQIDDQEKMIELMRSQLDALESLKSNIIRVAEIQAELLELEKDRENRLWDLNTNKQLYTGILDSMERMGTVRADFDLNLYRSLIQDDGTINTDLAFRLTRMLEQPQLDAAKIFDDNARTQLLDLIGKLTTSQDQETNYLQTSEELQTEYNSLQDQINSALQEFGFTAEDVGNTLYDFARAVSDVPFDELKNAITGIGTASSQSLSTLLNAGEQINARLSGIFSTLEAKVAGLKTGIAEGETGLNVQKAKLDLRNGWESFLNERANATYNRAKDWAGNAWYDGWWRGNGDYQSRWKRDNIGNKGLKLVYIKQTLGLDSDAAAEEYIFHEGGLVDPTKKPQTTGITRIASDELIARLQTGEYIVKRDAVLGNLEALENLNATGVLPQSDNAGNTYFITNNIELSELDYLQFGEKFSDAMRDKGFRVVIEGV